MRKFIIAMMMICMTGAAYPQVFIDCAVKGYLGTTWLINENIFKNTDYVHKISAGGGGGAKLGFNFNDNYELAGEAIYFNFNQNFTISENDRNWEKHIKINTIDFPILFRHNKDNGSYLEVGTQYTMLKQATETGISGKIEDGADNFDKSYWSAVLGFGGYMMGWENFGISLGFRVVYSFADIVSGGQAVAGTYKNAVADVPSYKPTNPLTAGLVLEFNYDLGYMAKSPCTGRRQFLFFTN